MDNSNNQFPGLLLSSRCSGWPGSVTKRAFISFIVWERVRPWRTQINYGCDYLVRSPDTSGLWTTAVTSDYLLCVVSLSPLHKCVVWLWGASVWLDVAWCVTILTIRHIWAGPLIIVSCSLLTYLSSETLDIDSDPVTMISHIIIVPRICSVLFLCLIDLVVIIWIMLRKLNFDHEMPLTLGLNVSNDHLLMISISYHHFYVLFISYTMISYNSDSRAHSRPLALVSRSAAIQIKTGLVGKSLD